MDTLLNVSDLQPRLKFEAKEKSIISSTLKLAEVDTASGRFCLNISKVKDNNGLDLFISRLTRQGNPSLFKNEDNTNLILTEDQKDRLKFCWEHLNVPIQVGTHIALNRPEIDIKDLKPAVSPKLLITLQGKPDAGKTSILGGLVTKYYPVFDMDRFAGRGVVEYSSNMFQFGSSAEPTLKAFRQNVNRKIQESLAGHKGIKSTMFQNLNVLTGIAFTGGKSVLLIDTPGYRASAREPDIFDLVTEQGLDGAFKIPNQFDWERSWQFVEHFPNREFLRFVKKRQKIVVAVRNAVLENM